MSSVWEELENQAALHTHMTIQEHKPRKNDNPKIACPNCGHKVSTIKIRNIMCYRCKKRFDRDPNPNLTLQEVPIVLVKQSEIEVGRFCRCGCGSKIPINARKDRVFFNPACRRNYLNKTVGYTDSKFVFRARLRINTPRTVYIYPSKGQIIRIPITKECKELWQFCDNMEEMRNNAN